MTTLLASENVCPAQNKQQPQPTRTDSLAKPLDWGIFSARLFSDSSKISFTLSTSWIPGENQKGMLRYKAVAFPETSDSENQGKNGGWGAAGSEAEEKLMKRVSGCLITLQLYDADGFILRKIPVAFSRGVDDQARVNSLTANDAVQMDAHSYRDFAGTSKRSGGWNVSWDCGPEDPRARSGAEDKKLVDGEDSTEHRASAQLRAIVEAIKKCPESDQTTSEFSMVEGKAKEGAFRRRVTAPVNVTGDIEQRPSSVRSREIGFIEFMTNESCSPTPPTTCKSRDPACWALFRSDSDTFQSYSEYCQSLKPNQYRYEFDFGTEHLEFSRALTKPENADKSLWVAIDLEHGRDWTDAVAASSCIADAVRLRIPSDTPETLSASPHLR
jgi:hypothetical protein